MGWLSEKLARRGAGGEQVLLFYYTLAGVIPDQTSEVFETSEVWKSWILSVMV
jgi:hypothetical protein